MLISTVIDARRSDALDQDDESRSEAERPDPELRMPCDGRCVPDALPDTFARAMKAFTQSE